MLYNINVKIYFFDEEIWKDRKKCHILWFHIITFSPLNHYISSGFIWKLRKKFPQEVTKVIRVPVTFQQKQQKSSSYSEALFSANFFLHFSEGT